MTIQGAQAAQDAARDWQAVRAAIAWLAEQPGASAVTAGVREQRLREIRAGLVWVNSWFLRDLRTPFGGSKQSGIGREGGVHSLEFYTDLKNVCIKL